MDEGDEDKVIFEEDNEFHMKSRRLLGKPETPGMVRFLLNTGIVKNEKQALIVLIGVIIVVVVATIWVFRVMNKDGVGYIIDSQGRKITAEEYIRLIKTGRDPLNK